MKISITGGTGFIGGYILKELAGRGHSLRALARLTSDTAIAKSVGADIVTGDILDDKAVERLVEGAEVIVHNLHCQDVKAAEDPTDYLKANVCASFWLLEAARRAGCRQFIFTSSAAVYGETFEGWVLDERHPTFPKNLYGAYKVCVETMCNAYHHQFKMNTVCLRPVYVYGIAPDLEDSLWADLIERVVRGEDVRTTRTGNIVSVETVAEAVALLVGNEEAAGQRINLADCYVEWQSVVELSREILGLGTHMHRHASEATVMSKKARQLGVNFRGSTGVIEYVKELTSRIKTGRGAHAQVSI